MNLNAMHFESGVVQNIGHPRFVAYSVWPEVLLPQRRSRAAELVLGGPSCVGTVLIIDDDLSLLEVMSEVFYLYNFRVKAFTHPQDAIEWHRSCNDRVDLVFLDMRSSFMTGEDCFPFLRKTDPHLPVVLMSGDLDETVVSPLLNDGALCLLQKPFNCLDVAEEVVRWLSNPADKGVA